MQSQSPHLTDVKSDYYRNRFQAILASSPYFKKFTLCTLNKKQKETQTSKIREIQEVSKHPIVTVSCDLCDYSTDRASNLRRHSFAMHRTPGSLALTCCGQTFPDKGSYRLHSRTEHKNGHECETCHRIFTRRALLRRHQSVHTGVKEFGCHLCTYATSHKSNLERHFKIHVDGRTKVQSSRPKQRNYMGSTFQNLAACWTKKRRTTAIGGGLHPGTSVSTTLLKACDQLKRTTNTSAQFSTTFTTLHGLSLNRSQISHSIESILNRPTVMEPGVHASLIKNEENATQIKCEAAATAGLQIEEPSENLKNETQAIQNQFPDFKSSLGSSASPFLPLPHFGHMSSSVLALTPQFQSSSSSVFMNQGQDSRLHHNYDYNTSSFLTSTQFHGAADKTGFPSPQSQYNYASEGNRLYFNALNDTIGALPYSLYLNSYNLFYQMQKVAEQRAELIKQKALAEPSSSRRTFAFVEKKEPSFTCRDNALAPIITSFTKATDNSILSSGARVYETKRIATTTSTEEITSHKKNMSSYNRKSRKRPSEEPNCKRSSCANTSPTVPDVENRRIPLKKRRENGRSS